MRINQILTEKELYELGKFQKAVNLGRSALQGVGMVGGGMRGAWDALKQGYAVGQAAVGQGRFPKAGTTFGRGTEYIGPAGEHLAVEPATEPASAEETKASVQSEIQNTEKKLSTLRAKLSDIENREATATPAAAPEAPKATAKSRTGGKVAGQVSQTPNAQRQRAARAAKKAPTTPNLQVQQGGKKVSKKTAKTAPVAAAEPQAPTAESFDRFLDLVKKIQH